MQSESAGGAEPDLARPGLVRLAVAGAVSVAASVAMLVVGPMGAARAPWLAVLLASWAAFGLSAWWALRAPAPATPRSRRRALGLVLLVAALCQLPGLSSIPLSSTDAYRYAWDGRVQVAGVSPYRYAPADDALARLRDPILFPGLGPDDSSGLTTVRDLPRERAAFDAVIHDDPRVRINRPRTVTIYPPAAEAWFAAVALVTPWSAGTLGLQISSALLALLTTLVIGLVLARRGGDPRWALVWGWAPVTLAETGNGAHADVLVAAAAVAALALLSLRRRVLAPVLGGIALGLAVSAKLLPLALLPVTVPLRHRFGPWLAAPVALLTVAATYVPYVLGAGGLVFGYLGGYLDENGFDSGATKFSVLAVLQVPPAARSALAVAVLLAVAVVVAWRTDPERPFVGAVVLYGTTLLVLTPNYPWYALPVVALAALARRPEWLVVALPGAVVNSVVPPAEVVVAVWGAAAGVVAVASLLRAVRSRTPLPAAGPAPVLRGEAVPEG
ncbi:hypothetical protein [Kineococcus rubinsiae]|uniref:hypothetical protein n=1 Tax=Kineococcus rubinsiae TaxID=2609562 RepID=UPI001431FD56|nr:hypothetical protein [Kineococcus rubinsiae]NIZ89726.1 DUF2029 domain-containing protein [Kineococcus rubinsiae]